MNRKIFAELVRITDNDPAKLTASMIKDTFDVELTDKHDNLVQYAMAIDNLCLHTFQMHGYSTSSSKLFHVPFCRTNVRSSIRF